MATVLQKLKFELFAAKYRNIARNKPCTIRYRKFAFDTPDKLPVIMQVKETFFDEYYYFETNTPSPVIYDCGANVGVVTTYLKQLFPGSMVRLYEADAAIGKYLQKNLQQNHITGVEVINKAVWTHTGHIGFNSSGSDSGSLVTDGDKIQVACTRLKDEILKEKKIDFLKMDIEGAELPVLQDCREVLPRLHHLFIEYHSFSGKEQELPVLLQLLSANNFRYNIYNIHEPKRPFVFEEAGNAFDAQLMIYAINQSFHQ